MASPRKTKKRKQDATVKASTTTAKSSSNKKSPSKKRDRRSATEEGRKTDGSATANAVVTAPSAVSAGTATTIVNTEVADAATPADDSGKDTGGGDKTKKILQQWRAQGPNIFGPLGVNPTDLAIQNSIVTAEAEEERRQWLDQMGGDLQHMDDKYIVRFNDGHFLKAIKKRYAEKHMGTDEEMLGANNPKVSFQHFTNVIENLLTNTKRSIYKCNTFPLTFCNPFAIGVLSFHIQGPPNDASSDTQDKSPRTPPRGVTSPSQSDVMTVDQVQRLMSSTTKTKAERTEEVQAEEDAQDLLERCSTVLTIDMRAAMLPWVREVEWNEGAHGGMLKSTLTELGIEAGPDGLVLTALQAPMNKDRCAIAQLTLGNVGDGGIMTLGSAITFDGMYQIADNYPPGTALDPLQLA